MIYIYIVSEPDPHKNRGSGSETILALSCGDVSVRLSTGSNKNGGKSDAG